jgi:hypothetical protein
MTDQFPDATQMVLSPAAQAIVNAAVEAGGKYGRATPVLHARLAAALRVVADRLDHSTSAHTLHAIADEFDDVTYDTYWGDLKALLDD